MSSLFGTLDPTAAAPAQQPSYSPPAQQPTALPLASNVAPGMNSAIKDYVGQVMAGNYTDAQRSEMIRSQAAKYGVTNDQIAAATGYDIGTVNSYLNPATYATPTPLPKLVETPVSNSIYNPTDGTWSASQMTNLKASTDPAILAAEQAARQATLNLGMPGRQQGVDPSVYQTLFSTNAQGQVVRNSDGFVSSTNVNDIKNPNAREWYAANPQEAFFLGSVADGQFKDANVRGTSTKLGNITPDQWYRGYTSNFEQGWDQDTSNTYRWAGQKAPAATSTSETKQAIRDYVGQVLSGNYTDAQRAQMISAQAAKYGITPQQIAEATGYDLDTVNKYLALAQSGSGAPASPGGVSASGSSSSGAPKTGFNLSAVAGPSQWEVNGNQTVANQLQSLLSSDNPLIQQARTRALQEMNARGTLNSSMAQTASDSAVYDAMMKVAQQDASTNASAAQTNTAAQNQFTTDANAFIRNGYMADFNLDANNWAAWQEFQRQRELMALESQYNNASTDKNVAQTNQQAYINGINQARSAWADKYAAIANDPNISPENRTASLSGLATAYNTTIRQYAGLLGWSPDSWLINYEVPTKTQDATSKSGTEPITP